MQLFDFYLISYMKNINQKYVIIQQQSIIQAIIIIDLMKKKMKKLDIKTLLDAYNGESDLKRMKVKKSMKNRK